MPCRSFYEEVIGLPLMTRVPNSAFFKVAEGYGGHAQVLALFDRSKSPDYQTIGQRLLKIVEECLPLLAGNLQAGIRIRHRLAVYFLRPPVAQRRKTPRDIRKQVEA
jgi:hypothetical protein